MLKSTSPSPRPQAVHKPYPMFSAENDFVTLPVKKDTHPKISPLDLLDARTPSDSFSEANFQSPGSHSYIDFKPPPTFSQQDIVLVSPSLSRDFGSRTTPPKESEYRALLSRLNTDYKPPQDPELKRPWDRRDVKTEFTSPRASHFMCVSKDDHERELREKLQENEEKWERKRIQLVAALEDRMREFESKVKLEYEQKTENKDRRATGTETEEGELQAKGLSDELLRKQFEEQLAEEGEKSVQQEKEITRLERLLAMKSADESELVTELRNEIDHLSREIDEKVTKLLDLSELLGEKEGEIEHLTSRLQKCARLETENVQLSAEIADLKSCNSLQETLKLSLQELEQENYLLKKDYEELLTLHNRTAHRDTSSGEETRFKPCSPLKRRFDSTESGLLSGLEAQETSDAMRQYEERCIELTDELEVWKAKANALESQHRETIESLRRDDQQLRTDVRSFVEQCAQQMQEVMTFLGERTGDEDRQD